MKTLTPHLKHRIAGFTLVELMIIVCILAVIMAIAVPNMVRARRRAQMVSMGKEMKEFADAFEIYSVENGAYPPDTGPFSGWPGTDMTNRLDYQAWQRKPPVGGNFIWNGPDTNDPTITRFGISIEGGDFTNDVTSLMELDKTIDDGVLATGKFRYDTNGVYMLYVKE